jgi:pimeloyl-ACP methyl ester carboxylesterase
MASAPRKVAASLAIGAVKVGPATAEGFRSVRVETSRGPVQMRTYLSAGPTVGGVVWMGGIGGGWDTPARGLYPRLCSQLRYEGFTSVQVRFRNATDLEEAELDALVALEVLRAERCEEMALVGHSFGGAVAIRAAARSSDVRAVITLATQSYGASAVTRLPRGCALLLAHGTADRVLTHASSAYLHTLATGAKQLVLLEGAGHDLAESAEQVNGLVREWLRVHLGSERSSGVSWSP